MHTVVLVALVVVALGTISLVQLNDQVKPPPPQATGVGTPRASDDPWLPHDNAADGYRLRYPANWSVGTIKYGAEILEDTTPRDVLEILPRGMSSTEWGDATFSMLLSLWDGDFGKPDMEVRASRETGVGGQAAMRFERAAPYDDQVLFQIDWDPTWVTCSSGSPCTKAPIHLRALIVLEDPVLWEYYGETAEKIIAEISPLRGSIASPSETLSPSPGSEGMDFRLDAFGYQFYSHGARSFVRVENLQRTSILFEQELLDSWVGCRRIAWCRALSIDLPAGDYWVTSYERICRTDCTDPGPPADSCEFRLGFIPDRRADVIIHVKPGNGCTFEYLSGGAPQYD